MPLYALENIDDALEVTKDFLTPIDRVLWAKLALIAFFVGGTGGTFPPFSGGGSSPGGQPGDPGGADLGPEVWLWIGAIFAIVVAIVLFLVFVGSIMEFVFVESLRREAVHIRRYWSERWGQGVRLFGFRLALWLVALAAFALVFGGFLLFLLGGVPVGGWVVLLGVLFLIPLFFVGALVFALIDSFTTHFVVPIMIREDVGVIAGWRRLWPTLWAQWKQYLAYALLAFVLNLAGGIVVSLVAGLGVLVLLVPFGILGGLGFAVLAYVNAILGGVLLAVVGILFVVAVLAVFALAQAPVKTYLRYYALLVLGDVDADFDLIPDQRAAVRSEDGGDGTTEPAA